MTPRNPSGTRPAAGLDRRRGRTLLTGRPRKTWLTAHVVTSVGWLGAAYCMLVLGGTGLLATDTDLRVGAYELMHLFDRAVNIPLASAALGTGIVLSVRTRWGLFRHYWIVVKLLLTCAVMVAAPLSSVPRVLDVARRLRAGADVGALPLQIVGISLVVVGTLTALTTISFFKPWGVVRGYPRAVPHCRSGRPDPQ